MFIILFLFFWTEEAFFSPECVRSDSTLKHPIVGMDDARQIRLDGSVLVAIFIVGFFNSWIKCDPRYVITLGHTHGRPQGRARGALAPPGPLAGQGQPTIVFFKTFFGKNSIFFVVFRQKVGSCPPWKIFALPWKKVYGRPWPYQKCMTTLIKF